MAPRPNADPEPGRYQTLQRLQIGLAGLGIVLLVIGLASAVLQRASNERLAGEVVAERSGLDAAGPQAEATPQKEPLVDLGVVPDLPGPDVPADATPAGAAPAPQAVMAAPAEAAPDLPARGEARPTPAPVPVAP